MKQLFLPILLFLFLQEGIAQDKQWYLGITASVFENKNDYGFSYFDDCHCSRYFEKRFWETPKGNSLQINIERRWNPKWSLQSGLGFERFEDRSFFLPSFIPSPILRPDQSLESYVYGSGKSSFDALAIPLYLKRYFRSGKKTSPYITLGLSTQFTIRETGFYSSFRSNEQDFIFHEQSNFRFHSLGFDFGTGLQWQHNPRWTFVFNAMVRFSEFKKGNQQYHTQEINTYSNYSLNFSQVRLGLGVKRRI